MTDGEQNSSVFHDFSNEKSKQILNFKNLLLFLIVIALGIGAGYILSKGRVNSFIAFSKSGRNNSSSVPKGTVMGSSDVVTFKDTAEGVLQKGGINGEGLYHLVREGGDSQNVYLTSSIVDLSQFIGMKVKVHGQTQKAKTAGWLMDVGQVEVE